MGTAHRARAEYTFNMKFLLVCTVIAAASAAPQLPLTYGGYYGFGGFPYAVPNIIKPVAKEIEIPVKTLEYAVAETGCKNVFGFEGPCAAEGEARKRRDADEEAAAEEAAPAPAVLPYGLPFGYAGLPYAAAPVIKPTVTEVEVPQYKFVPQVEKVEFAPACHNGFGFPVPCAV